MSVEQDKQAAAEAAAELVEDGMTVGLGTGTTVVYPLPALAQRSLNILCAATSPRTEHAARDLGLRMEPIASIDRFDLTIDGADQIAPDGWLVKGGGAAHTPGEDRRGGGRPLHRHRRLHLVRPGQRQSPDISAALVADGLVCGHDSPLA